MSKPDDVSADVVVIGSGLAGATVARTISDIAPSTSVVLVDVGPALSDAPGEHVRNLDGETERDTASLRAQGPLSMVQSPVSTYVPPLTMGAKGVLRRPGLFLLGDLNRNRVHTEMASASMTSCVGGMGVFWRGSCPRPLGSEITSLISRDEFDFFIETAYSLLGVSAASNGQSPVRELLCEVLNKSSFATSLSSAQIRPLPMACKSENGRIRWTGTRTLLDRVAADPLRRIRILPETLAMRIGSAGGDAREVELLDMRRMNKRVIRCRVVVVAADAFRTPQILFASDVRSPALGRYLNEHLLVTAQIELNPVIAQRVRDHLATVEGPDIGGCWIPFEDATRPYHGQILYHFEPARSEPSEPLAVGLSLYGRKEIVADDRVEFSPDQLDTYGMPGMSVRYRLTTTDIATTAAMVSVVQAIAESIGTLDSDVNVLPPGGLVALLWNNADG